MQTPRLLVYLCLLGLITRCAPTKSPSANANEPFYEQKVIYRASFPTTRNFPKEFYIGLEKNNMVIVPQNKLNAMRSMSLSDVKLDALAAADLRIHPIPPKPKGEYGKEINIRYQDGQIVLTDGLSGAQLTVTIRKGGADFKEELKNLGQSLIGYLVDSK